MAGLLTPFLARILRKAHLSPPEAYVRPLSPLDRTTTFSTERRQLAIYANTTFLHGVCYLPTPLMFSNN
jgi:hypothetical protein